MTLKEAKIITGGLTKTSKLPGLSFSTSAKRCNIGSKLRKRKGSICAFCYGCKGNYKKYEKTILPAQEKRWRAVNNEVWIEAMCLLIGHSKAPFRWFDTGDIKDQDQLKAIFAIAERLPDIAFWLPTKEYNLVERFLKTHKAPDNLTIRYSAYLVDKPAPARFANTSTVHKDTDPIGFACPSSKQGGKCRDCRACWNKDVKNVSYKIH